jgi:hypothetical protein
VAVFSSPAAAAMHFTDWCFPDATVQAFTKLSGIPSDATTGDRLWALYGSVELLSPFDCDSVARVGSATRRKFYKLGGYRHYYMAGNGSLSSVRKSLFVAGCLAHPLCCVRIYLSRLLSIQHCVIRYLPFAALFVAAGRLWRYGVKRRYGLAD